MSHAFQNDSKEPPGCEVGASGKQEGPVGVGGQTGLGWGWAGGLQVVLMSIFAQVRGQQRGLL